MRILQICQRPQRRGAEVFAVQLNAALARQGHEVATVYLYPHAGRGVLSLGPDDRLLEGEENHPLETFIGFRPALLHELTRVTEAFRPTVTQANGARTVKYAILARRLERAPTGPVIYRNIGSPDDWIRGVRRKLFYRALLRKVDGVAAISRSALDGLESAFPGRTPRTVISNGIDPDALRPSTSRAEVRASAGTPPWAPVVLFVGSLGPEKRVDRLIDAVARVRSRQEGLYLWIVGEGPLRQELETRARDAELSGVVRFFGSRDDVADFLAAADLLALTSDTEGVPGVVLEAGCLGLPVLATRVGAIEECVLEGETAVLVDPGDQDGLVAALARLTGDPELRVRLGVRGRRRILEAHSMDRIAREFVDFYAAVRNHGEGEA